MPHRTPRLPLLKTTGLVLLLPDTRTTSIGGACMDGVLLLRLRLWLITSLSNSITVQRRPSPPSPSLPSSQPPPPPLPRGIRPHGSSKRLDAIPSRNRFHNASKVEINKQTKRQYKRKRFALPDGEEIQLTCEHRIRYCSKEELAKDFVNSELHKELIAQGCKPISERTAQSCICDCIKEVRRSSSSIKSLPSTSADLRSTRAP